MLSHKEVPSVQSSSVVYNTKFEEHELHLRSAAGTAAFMLSALLDERAWPAAANKQKEP